MREDTKTCTFSVDSEYVDLAAEVFALLADPTRIRIVLALRAGEMSVNPLAAAVGKSPATVSQHLAKLRWAKIVRPRQEGTKVFYSLVDDHARKLVADAVFQAQHVVEDTPAHHAEHPDPATVDRARRRTRPDGAAPTCPSRPDVVQTGTGTGTGTEQTAPHPAHDSATPTDLRPPRGPATPTGAPTGPRTMPTPEARA